MIHFLIRTQQGAFVAIAVPVGALMVKVEAALAARYTEPRLESFISSDMFAAADNKLVLTAEVL